MLFGVRSVYFPYNHNKFPHLHQVEYLIHVPPMSSFNCASFNCPPCEQMRMLNFWIYSEIVVVFLLQSLVLILFVNLLMLIQGRATRYFNHKRKLFKLFRFDSVSVTEYLDMILTKTYRCVTYPFIFWLDKKRAAEKTKFTLLSLGQFLTRSNQRMIKRGPISSWFFFIRPNPNISCHIGV